MSNSTLSETGNLHRVLVVTDGSDESAGAIRTGVALAALHGARLIGLSIALDNPEYATLVPNLKEAAELYAREALQSFIEEAGIGAEAITREATDPVQGIIDAATELNADIVVIGQQNKGSLARRLMVGGATAGVIGHAPCPVLVAPRAAHLWEKRVLLATDGSSHSEAAAVAAGRVARHAGLPVNVVSVVTSSHNEERRNEADRAVASALARLTGLELQTEGQVAEGRPDEAIIKTAESLGADLIVVGSKGRTGLAKILLGSVAERVIGHATCPVLVVKA